MANAIQKTKQDLQQVDEMLGKILPRMQEMVPEGQDAQYLRQMAWLACYQEPKLLACKRDTLVKAVLQACKLGLPIGVENMAFLVPYGNEVQFQLGYQGMRELAHETGQVKAIWADCVYETDYFDYEKGDDPKLKHKPDYKQRDRGKFIGAYAVARLSNGETVFEFCPDHQIEHIRKSSKTGNVWKLHTDAMRKKTAIRQLWKILPKGMIGMRATRAMQLDSQGEGGARQVYDYDVEMAAIPYHEEPKSKLDDFNDSHTPEVDEPAEYDTAEGKLFGEESS